MYQLPLDITPRLPYSPEGFYVHQGVKTVVDFCCSQVQIEAFRICVVYGAARSGKTHLSIKLAADFAAAGAKPRLMDGISLEGFLSEQGADVQYADGTVIIIDNAEQYLTNLAPDRSGEFVNMVEALRRSRSGLILLTGQRVDDFPIDDHVRSRLRPGEGFFIGNPEEKEVETLIDLMSRQRGIKLTPKKISFLSKRLGRSIPAISEALNTLLAKSEEGTNIDSFDVLASIIPSID